MSMKNYNNTIGDFFKLASHPVTIILAFNVVRSANITALSNIAYK